MCETGLTSITIPSSVTTIKANCFKYCNLSSVTFEDTDHAWSPGGVSGVSVANEETNATNLKTTYVSYEWIKDAG